MAENVAQATRALKAHLAGEPNAGAALLPLVYDNLRALARHYMRGEARQMTLQPTALVHEAYLRLIDTDSVDWRGKTHFFALAAREMRRVMVDHARAANAQKRGGGVRCVTLPDNAGITPSRAIDLLILEEALSRLSRRNPRQARVVELKLYAGLLVREIASVVGASERTVKGDWRVGRAWLARELATHQP